MKKLKSIAAWTIVSLFFVVVAFGTPIMLAIDGRIGEAVHLTLMILGTLLFVAAVTWAAWHLLDKIR